jgi:hypothetical protein
MTTTDFDFASIRLMSDEHLEHVGRVIDAAVSRSIATLRTDTITAATAVDAAFAARDEAAYAVAVIAWRNAHRVLEAARAGLNWAWQRQNGTSELTLAERLAERGIDASLLPFASAAAADADAAVAVLYTDDDDRTGEWPASDGKRWCACENH